MNHTLSQWQLFLMIINFMAGSALVMAPSVVIFLAQQNAWISVIVATVIGFLINAFLLLALRRYGYASIFRIVEHVAGRWIGRTVILLIVFACIHTGSLDLRNMSNFVTTLMPETNAWVFQWMILLTCVYSIYYGAVNIGRVNEIISPIMAAIFYGSLMVVANQFSFDQLQPVLDNGWGPVLHGAYTIIGFPFTELVMFSAFLTFVKTKRHISRTFLSALTIGGVSLALGVVFVIGVEEISLATAEVYPLYSLMRNITVSRVFDRVEALIAIVWVLSFFVKVVITFLTGLLGLSQLAAHHRPRSFILPVALLIWAMSNYTHPNIVDYTEFVLRNWTPYWLSVYALVMSVLIWGIIRKKDRMFNGQGRLTS